jgi:XRE family aerobic/anaerobic benzoate catabolism transcriptional regulator
MSRSHHALLAACGARLREAREARGLALAALARETGLSRRYLTEAEAGRANPSLLVLAKLAQALHLRLPELLELPAFGAARTRVALVGLRGAGKSSVARLLAPRLDAACVELDQRVEALAGLSLAEIFALQGEAHFHRLEAEALEAVLAEGERLVLATGGSIVASEQTFARLRASCRTVWLKASPEEHYERVLAQGDRRPMARRPRAMDELRALLARREPLYRQCSLTIDTSGRSADEVARELERALDFEPAPQPYAKASAAIVTAPTRKSKGKPMRKKSVKR